MFNLTILVENSIFTDFDQKISERLYHLPETLKIMFVKIEGEKQVILNEFKSYVEKTFLNNKIQNVLIDIP